jgi:phosphomevalonate kinase
VRIVARAPGKLVALGEYAVLDGAPALVLAVDRYAVATIEASSEAECTLETRAPASQFHRFAADAPSGLALIDTVRDAFPTGSEAWRALLDTTGFFATDGAKLGLGSSAAALTAFAAALARHAGREQPAVDFLIDLHRRLQGGSGSGIDVAASCSGGATIFRLDGANAPQIGSVRFPNSVGFAGIFAGRSASTPQFVARYRAWKAAAPAVAAQRLAALRQVAEAGCMAARGDDAAGFITAVAEYGRELDALGAAIGAEVVTAEHREIGAEAARYGVAYKVSGAGGGDVGIAVAADRAALAAFGNAVSTRGYRVIDFALAEQGLVVEEQGL